MNKQQLFDLKPGERAMKLTQQEIDLLATCLARESERVYRDAHSYFESGQKEIGAVLLDHYGKINTLIAEIKEGEKDL